MTGNFRYCTFTFLLLIAIAILPATSKAQNDITAEGFKRSPDGLLYKIIIPGQGMSKPQQGDHVEVNINVHDGDSVMYDSKRSNNNTPVVMTIGTSKYKGDLIDCMKRMVAGERTIFRLAVSELKKAGTAFPVWVKDEDNIEYDITLVSVRSAEEERKLQAENMEKQKSIDDNLLIEYFRKNNINATKTTSGLYYQVTSPGNGETITKGNIVSVNYTGRFLDGRKFDSNTDPEFKHVQPYSLEIGAGKVIKGWEEGLQLLKEGARATLYIPSSLAYGAMERRGVPANSILTFDIEVIKRSDPVQQAATDDKLIQAYIGKNNIKATKTPSGLYIMITNKGLGPNAIRGKKVTVNYTGKLLDGIVFDSNIDPAFKHAQPYTLMVGRGQVIKGWDEALQLMNLGSKATIIIPSTLAYGPEGANGIPPNAVLVYDVEMTAVGD